MAFNSYKITDGDISDPVNGKGVQTKPNKLTGSALENKKVFDALVTDVVKAKFNALIDELTAITAAAQIGADVDGLTSTNVNAALAELLAAMQDITQGSVADGSITTAKLAGGTGIPGAVTPAKLNGILPEHVGIKHGTTVPTSADISDGEIYFMYTEEE